MVEDTIATKHRLIGMIQPAKINAGKELSENNKYQKVGCAGRIVSFTETHDGRYLICLLYTSPSPRDATLSRMPSSA